jgi:hypothetical protein
MKLSFGKLATVLLASLGFTIIPLLEDLIGGQVAFSALVNSYRADISLLPHSGFVPGPERSIYPRPVRDGDKFTVQRLPNQELARLLPFVEKTPFSIRQAAVWIVTDNANYEDMRILTSSLFGERAVRPADAARAMRICERAGIDITTKAIWRNRTMLLNAILWPNNPSEAVNPASVQDIKEWLESKQ